MRHRADSPRLPESAPLRHRSGALFDTRDYRGAERTPDRYPYHRFRIGSGGILRRKLVVAIIVVFALAAQLLRKSRASLLPRTTGSPLGVRRSAFYVWLRQVMGIRGIPIPYGAPNAAAHIERLIGMLRREYLVTGTVERVASRHRDYPLVGRRTASFQPDAGSPRSARRARWSWYRLPGRAFRHRTGTGGKRGHNASRKRSHVRAERIRKSSGISGGTGRLGPISPASHGLTPARTDVPRGRSGCLGN